MRPTPPLATSEPTLPTHPSAASPRAIPRWLRQRPPARFTLAPGRSHRFLPTSLRLLSFNIQSGIRTDRYREYLTRGWRQIAHDTGRPDNLARIGAVLADHDLVALQEVDAGSFRSGYTNQVAWLANQARLPFWYAQRNRRLGRFAQHGNGLLARTEPMSVEDHPLPSTIPGRGAILARFPCADGLPLLMVSAHLSLGLRARNRQLAWLAERIAGQPRVVVMGDFNASGEQLASRSPLARTSLVPALDVREPTWPSWRPRLDLDHVLLSPDLVVVSARTLPCRFSDHLPLSVTIRLPAPA